MKKDAYYFPHFSNARADRKLKRVRKGLGIEGYGIYFMVLETLREQTDFKYPMEDIDLLADEFGTSEQKTRAIVCNYDLFNIDDDDDFFSPKMLEYLTPYLENKERKRIGGIKGNLLKYGKITRDKLDKMSDGEVMEYHELAKTAKFSHTDSESDSDTDRSSSQSKVKKSKVKESKANSIEARELAFKDELRPLIEKYNQPMIQEFFDYWKEPNKSKSKMRWETEKTWDLNSRLARWANNNFNSPKSAPKPIKQATPSFDHEQQIKDTQDILKRINDKSLNK